LGLESCVRDVWDRGEGGKQTRERRTPRNYLVKKKGSLHIENTKKKAVKIPSINIWGTKEKKGKPAYDSFGRLVEHRGGCHLTTLGHVYRGVPKKNTGDVWNEKKRGGLFNSWDRESTKFSNLS